MRSTLKALLDAEFQLPFHVAAIGVNGSFLAVTYSGAETGLAAEIHAVHSDGHFAVPVNIMVVDSRGEAARVLIGGSGSAVVLQ